MSLVCECPGDGLRGHTCAEHAVAGGAEGRVLVAWQARPLLMRVPSHHRDHQRIRDARSALLKRITTAGDDMDALCVEHKSQLEVSELAVSLYLHILHRTPPTLCIRRLARPSHAGCHVQRRRCPTASAMRSPVRRLHARVLSCGRP